MINIDAYVDSVFSEIKFIDLDIITINAFMHSRIRTNKLFTNRTVFDEKRKAVFDLHLIEFESRKKANIFKENDFLENIKKETQTAIESYKTWVTVKNTKIDLEKIDFQELAFIAGMIDFINFLDFEILNTVNTIKHKKSSFNLRPNITARQIKEIHEALTQHLIIDCDFIQIERLFCVNGFEKYKHPIQVIGTIKELAFAFDELLKKGIFNNKQWKADLSNAKVFIKDGIILTSKNFQDAIGSVKYKEFINPKELFLI